MDLFGIFWNVHLDSMHMDFKHTWFCLGNDSLLTPFLKMFMCAERERDKG